MTDETCEGCLFSKRKITLFDNYDGSLTHKEIVICRRYPPSTIVVDRRPITEFAIVDSLDWCGEWKDKLSH